MESNEIKISERGIEFCENCGYLYTSIFINIPSPSIFYTCIKCKNNRILTIQNYSKNMPKKNIKELLGKINDFDFEKGLPEKYQKNTEILKYIPLKCEDDNINEIEEFCSNCKMHICKICSEQNHKGHKKNIISWTKEKELFRSTINNLNLAFIKIGINNIKYYNDMTAFLSSRLNELNNACQLNEEESQTIKREIQRNGNNIKKTLEELIGTLFLVYNLSTEINYGLLSYVVNLTELLIDTYPIKNSIIIGNFIANTLFNISVPPFTGSPMEDLIILIDYFKNDFVLEPLLNKQKENKGALDKNTIKITSFFLKPLKIIREHKNSVRYLLKLKNNNLVSCGKNKFKIFYFNSSGKYEFLFEVKEHLNTLYNIIELDNGCLVSAFKDKTVKIYSLKYQEKKPTFFESVFKSYYNIEKNIKFSHEIHLVINLTENRFGVGSNGVYVYEGKADYSLQFIIHGPTILEMIQLTDGRIFSVCKDEKGYFWNLDEKFIENEKTISEIDINFEGFIFPHCVKQIDNNLIFISQRTCLSTFDISKCQFIGRITIKNILTYGAAFVFNKNAIFVCCGKNIYLVNYNLTRVEVLQNAHYKKINDIIFTPNNNQILTCSDDGEIKVWGI